MCQFISQAGYPARPFEFGIVELDFDVKASLWRWRCMDKAPCHGFSAIGHRTQPDAFQAAWFSILKLPPLTAETRQGSRIDLGSSV